VKHKPKICSAINRLNVSNSNKIFFANDDNVQ